MSKKNEETVLSVNIGKNSMKEIDGEYILKGIIGEGTFSKVKLGINKFTGQKVAIKILDKLKLIEVEGIERVLREIKISSELNHPNIIKIYKIIEEEKNYLVIMEYCEEGELFNYIVKKERLSENESSFFYYQLINALEYLHSKGIAHRDLKPENILLGENHIIKLIDFGLSNYFDENKLLITPCGSPCYASPEMIRGEDYNGPDNDIWATGIILYAMLCGYLPFENEDNDKNNNLLFKKILSGKLDYPKYLSDTAVDLIKKILVNSPKNRIKINEIKKHSFYLKGKKIYDKKMETIFYQERISNYLSNNFSKNYNYNLLNKNKTNQKDGYLKNIFSRNNNKYINNNIINILKNKYFDSKEHMVTTFDNKNNKILTSANNKNTYLATESNNIKLNIDNLIPSNIKQINSAKREKIKQDYNDYYENNLTKKDNSENEIIKNITNILPYRENKYNLINNLFNIYKKREKSMDPHKNNNNKLYPNKNSINTDLNFNSPNKRPLLQVKKYSSTKKDNRRLYEKNDLYNNININKQNYKMNDKLIINLTNNEEKNNSLLRINKKIQSLDKYMNLNGSFKNLNTRLKTDFKNNDNFPIINRPRNGNIFSPKIERRYGDKTDMKYLFNNIFNLVNLKDKDNLNYFFNSKNNNISPSIKI